MNRIGKALTWDEVGKLYGAGYATREMHKVFLKMKRDIHYWLQDGLLAGTQILKDYIKTSNSLEEALRKYSNGAKDYHKKVIRRMRG